MDIYVKNIGMYFCAISLIGILVTAYDKIASKHLRHNRVRENAFFVIAILGGSGFMYLTMLLIRHKTKHKSFMLGIPAIIVLQGILTLIAYYIFFR